jgi:hypothetical protein
MTAALPPGPGLEGLRTLEVRWILPGPLDASVTGWFGRFPAETDSRADTYLVSPVLRGLSVKVRGGRALEVKIYHGSPGMLAVPGAAHGYLQSWRKWSFPIAPLGQGGDDPAGWTAMHKGRRISRFRLADGRVVAGVPEPAGKPAGEAHCAVELTEVSVLGETWWSLAFEAAGPAELLRAALEGTAALIFAQALPDGVDLSRGTCCSYTEWLTAQPI